MTWVEACDNLIGWASHREFPGKVFTDFRALANRVAGWGGRVR
ncbi:MAG: hypothetical protein AB9903_13145 [Vulcanimicrobiota bacterium]